MKRVLIAACAVIICVTASAQTATQRIVIPGGNSAWDNYLKEVFLYPSFESGIVEYKNGQRYKSNLNYNKVIGSIQFIDEKGDTLELSNVESVRSVTIGNDAFYFIPECIQRVKSADKCTLYKHEQARIADKMKNGAYGLPNSTGTIESVDRLDTKWAWNRIDINESLLISKVSTYYIENEKGEILPASKKNIYTLYPKKVDAIKSFMKSNNINLLKEEEFVTLTEFLSTL